MNKEELGVMLDSLGWTQRKLAEKMGMSEVTVSRWGEVPVPVARYLGLAVKLKDMWDILEGEWLGSA